MSSAIGMQGRQPVRGRYTFDIRNFGAVANSTQSAVANVAALQAALDAASAVSSVLQRAEVVVPNDGIYYLKGPAFLSGDGVTVRGDGAGAQLRAFGYNGPLLVLAVPRAGKTVSGSLVDLYGLMDYSIASGPGKAFGLAGGPAALAVRGTPLELGSATNMAGVPSFYQNESQLTIAFAVVPQGTQGNFTVARFAGNVLSMSGGTTCTFKFTTSDRQTRSVSIPVSLTADKPLRVVLQLDLNACQAAAYVDGYSVAVDTANVSSGWTAGANLRLSESGWGNALLGGSGAGWTLGGFKISNGLLYPMATAPGAALGTINDSTLFRYKQPTDIFAVQSATSATADFVPWWGGGLDRFFAAGAALCVPTDFTGILSAVPYQNMECKVRDLSFYAGVGYGAGLLYGTLRGLTVDNCRFEGGSHGLTTIGTATSYPVWIQDCVFNGHTHAAVLLNYGINQLRRLRLTGLGRYGIVAHSSMKLEDFYIAEGNNVQAAIKSWGLAEDGSYLRIRDGFINFEAYAAQYMMDFRYLNTYSWRSDAVVENVQFGRVKTGSTAIRVYGEPALVLRSNYGRYNPFDLTIRTGTGEFLAGSPAALVGVSGACVRVRHEGPYSPTLPLCRHDTDPDQPTWSGFTPGSEPDRPTWGTTLSPTPPAAVVSPRFAGLANLPGLYGRYRAGFLGNVGDTVGPLLDDTTGSNSARAPRDLYMYKYAAPPSVIAFNGSPALDIQPHANNHWRDGSTAKVDLTQGATILWAGQGSNYLFRTTFHPSLPINFALWVDDTASLNGFCSISPSAAPRGCVAVHAVRFNRATGVLEWWTNGRLDQTTTIVDPTILSNYVWQSSIVGGIPSSQTSIQLHELLTVVGPLGDQDLKDAMYQLMNDYHIHG